MATNFFINNFNSSQEQRLLEDLIIESIRFYGQDMQYIPRVLNKYDDVYGADDQSSYEIAYPIEMYIKSIDGFSGDGDFLSKFGIEIRNQVVFSMAQRIFTQEVGVSTNQTRPNEGDLIYFPVTKYIFEIGFVDHDDPFYQLHNLPIFKLKCRTFEYSSEEFNTNVEEIDLIEDTYSLSMQTYQISLENEVGSLVLEDSLTGSDVYYIINEDYELSEIEKTSQNQDFEILNDNILDFTESNPFGDVI